MDRNGSSLTPRKKTGQTLNPAPIVSASTSSKQRSKKVNERDKDEDVRNYDSSDMTDGSEFESPVEDEEDNKQIFYIDAIMYAHFRDSRSRKHSLGWYGWWKGYLKSLSDTEEPLSSFETELNIAPLVTSFWQAVDKPIPKGKLEPPGKKGDYYEIPPDQMEEMLLTCYPKRTWKIYSRRRAKQRAHQLAPPKIRNKPLRVQKRDSDYYNYERYKKRRKAMHESEERQRETVGIKKKEEKKPQEWVLTSASDSDSTEMSLDDENDALSTSDKRPQGKSKKDPRKTRKYVASSSEEEDQAALEVTNVKKKKRRITSSASSSVPLFFDSPRSSKGKERPIQPSVEVKVPIAADQMKSRQPSPATSSAQLSFGQLQPGIFDPDPPVEATLGGEFCHVPRTAASTTISSVSAATQSFTTMQQSQSHPLQSIRPSQAPGQTQTRNSRQLSPPFQPQPQSQLQAQFVLQPQPETQTPSSISAASVSGLPADSPKSQPKSTSLPENQSQQTIADTNSASNTPLAALPQHNSRQDSRDNARNTISPPPDSIVLVDQQQKQTITGSVEPILRAPVNCLFEDSTTGASRPSTTPSSRQIPVYNQPSNLSGRTFVSSLQEPIDLTSSPPHNSIDLPSSTAVLTNAGQNAPSHVENTIAAVRKKYEQPKLIKTIDDANIGTQAIDIKAIRNSRKEQEHDGEAPHLLSQAPGRQKPKELTRAQRRRLDEENLTRATRLSTVILHRQSPQDIGTRPSSQSRQSSEDSLSKADSGAWRTASVSTNAGSMSPTAARKRLDSRSPETFHRGDTSRYVQI
ncbi:hypothetical protein I314_02705 [Cryptococcus bacillisporus CA1873]|uniref:Uncharacterized protein n=1 Tax=Cryptococcus bacillisporus CA1873 TaxID=1296111 RepID=A0ABR5BC91_CRYGA|nr:hypothetical protein I314_02705 [Cryptococcus bacillisporus CA1873]|eukprot:KIR63924.1 hypothetical protein I314_02705 [Cryptococcus gattii CA1873]